MTALWPVLCIFLYWEEDRSQSSVPSAGCYQDISFSPQCLGLAVGPGAGSGCKKPELEWRPDLSSRELALCMGESALTTVNHSFSYSCLHQLTLWPTSISPYVSYVFCATAVYTTYIYITCAYLSSCKPALNTKLPPNHKNISSCMQL